VFGVKTLLAPGLPWAAIALPYEKQKLCQQAAFGWYMPRKDDKRLDNENCVTIVMLPSRMCKGETGFAAGCGVVEKAIVHK
jgi:hypothetical protein